MIRAGLLCLVLSSPAAAQGYRCHISTLCDAAGECTAFDAPLDMTITLPQGRSGTVVLDGRQAVLTPAGGAGQTVTWLAREGTRSAALISLYGDARVVVSVQDFKSPAEAVIMTGGCGRS